MDPAGYQGWLAGGASEGSLASTGEKVFQQLGCATCHRFDTQGIGPNLIGLFGKQQLLDNGQTVTADENYVRESILDPRAKVVAGFQPVMPTFQGIVDEEQLLALVAYLKSISTPQQNRPVPARPMPSAPAAETPAGETAGPRQ
jgi:cytochrome c oxidase subunit 2